MFSREGADRSERSNRILAGTLASVAGFVNAVGFVNLGAFTSHATGNIGHVVDDVARGRGRQAVAGLLLVGMFFVGAFFASVVIEARPIVRPRHAYAALLLMEAGALLSVALSGFVGPPRGLSALSEVGILCFAMGVQNSLVTRLSGAVVRTTHLTGALTDLGIEAARWTRAVFAKVEVLPRSADDRNEGPEPPRLAKSLLLACIVVSFMGGGVAGATLALTMGLSALCLPAAALLAGAAYAALARRSLADANNRP